MFEKKEIELYYPLEGAVMCFLVKRKSKGSSWFGAVHGAR